MSMHYRGCVTGFEVSLKILNFSDSSPGRQSLAMFLAVKFASLDRYCKSAMCFGARSNSRPFLFSMDFAKKVNISTNGPLRLSGSIYAIPRGFCLIRFTVDGVCRYIIK